MIKLYYIIKTTFEFSQSRRTFRLKRLSGVIILLWIIRPRILEIELIFKLGSNGYRGFILSYLLKRLFEIEPPLIGFLGDSGLDSAKKRRTF